MLLLDYWCACVCLQEKSDNTQPPPIKLLHPVSVVFQYKSMTSVLAVRQGSWVVFFIGTGDGQLIKVCIHDMQLGPIRVT